MYKILEKWQFQNERYNAMKSAVITGASGFIGKAVCGKLIQNGVKVYAIVRKTQTMPEFLNNKNFIEITGNLQNIVTVFELLKKYDIDVFYHFAWVGTSGSALSDYSMQIENINYTCETLKLADQLKCKKYIFAGTINELELLPFFSMEDFLPRPANIYGISKLACDFMCKTLASNLDICYNTAIIGSCFGPGDKSWRIHNSFIKGMIEGKAPRLIDGNVLHDWIYIDDVADMFYAIGKKSVDMRTYYIGHRNLRLLKDILYDVRDLLGSELKLIFGEIESSFEIDYSLVDLDAVYNDTGYECKTDFATAVLKTAEWVKSLI